MRYRLLFFVLFVSIMACSFQTNVLTPEPASNVDGLTSTPPAFPGVGDRTATPPVPPTFTLTPTLTVTPTPVNLGVFPIRFAPNGTYIDLGDNISVGKSKTYSVSASKGQVMSVSVNLGGQAEWGYMTMRITGADGTFICPTAENTDCPLFWRGTLPATQDYLITLIPIGVDQNFTLRVVINPPGAQTQSFQYVSPTTNTSFSYTDEFAPVRALGYTIFKIEPEVRLAYIDTQAFVDRNLVEAYFLFGSSNDPALVENCLQISPLIPNEQLIDTVNINGKQFTHSAGGGAAAGSFYEPALYRTMQNNTCYEVTFLFHSFNTGALLPQTVVQEYDRAALLQKFESILSTLVIK